MVDFLEKLASFSDTILDNGGSRNAMPAPAPMKIELPPVPDVPVVSSVPTAPVTSAPLAPLPSPQEAAAAKYKQDEDQIDQFLSNPVLMAKANVSRERDNDLTKNNQILNDRKTLPEIDFIAKHGDRIFQKVAVLDAGRGHLADLQGGERSTGQIAGDIAVGVGSGLAQSVGGLTALAAGAVNDRAGVAVAEGLGILKEATDGMQSRTMQRRKFVDSLRGELDKQDNANRFEKDKEESGELIASLKSIGRGVISGAGRLAEDPTMIEAGLSEAAGSLLAGGPVAKGLGAGASLVAGRVMTAAPGAVVAGGAGARAAEKALTQAALPLTIGAMEGGGAYAQTIQEVMKVPHETLMKDSTAYKALRDRGLSERDAKIELATRAGDVATALTFPVGALTGTLVTKFEGNPLTQLSKGGPRQFVGNMGKEFSEELIQSGTGEFAGNVGQKVTVDPNKNLGEGVGEAAIQGAIFGAGSAAAIGAPGLAARGVREAGRAVLAPFEKAITERANAVRAANESAGALAPEKVQADLAQASVEAPAVAEAVRSVAADPAIAPEEKAAVERIAVGVETIFAVPETEIETLPSQTLREAAVADMGDGRRPSRFDLMSVAASVAQSDEMEQGERTNAALWLLGQLAQQSKFIETGSEVLGKLDHTRPEVVSFQRFNQILDAASQTKSMQDALRWAREELTAPTLAADADLSTPEAKSTIQATAEIARLVPEKLDLATADVILRQDKLTPDGSKLLTPAQRQDVHAALALAQASEVYNQAIGDTTLDRVSLVNRQIEIEGGAKAYQKSLTEHASDINAAAKSGDEVAFKAAMKHLAMFARSMRNKAVAMNEAIVSGDRARRGYQALGADNTYYMVDPVKNPKTGVYYNPGTEASLRTALQIQADARTVAELANSFAQEYPQLGLKEIQIPELAADPKQAVKAPAARGSSDQASKIADQSQATTSEIDPDPSQIELPLPAPEPKPAQKAAQAAPEMEKAQSTAPVNSGDASGSTEEVSARPEVVASAAVDARSDTRDTIRNEDTTQKTEEAFPSLLKSAGRNLFHEAFRFTKEQSSNLMAELSPLRWLDTELGSSEEVVPLRRLLRLVNKAGAAMNRRLNGDTGIAEKDKGIRRLLDLLQKDDEKLQVLRFDDARVYNLAESKDGKIGYHEQLLEAALVAGADWLINGQQGQANYDREDIASSFGIDDPTPEMVEFFNRGMSVDQAKQALAKRIVEFWGMQSKADADIVYAEGIPQALATEMLHGFQEQGLIVYENVERFRPITGKSYGRVYFDLRSDEMNDLFAGIGPTRKMIGELSAIEGLSDTVRIGEPFDSKDVSKTQLRNAAVATTRGQRKAQAREQAVPYLLNQLMFELVKQMGENAFVMLMAGRIDAEKLNVNHARSVEGKILGLRMAFRNVMTHVAELDRHAAEKNVDVTEVPTFFRHEITRVGRLQMMGLANPQSDKLAREILMPTRSELDLNKPKHMDFFWLTVAQGLGVKTEQKTRDQSRTQAEALIAGPFAPIVAELKTWLASQDRGKPVSLAPDLAQRVRDAAGGSITMHGFHSLLSVARLQLAQETNQDLSKFEHFNYLEADGKTNGPINALMLLASGKFSRAWLDAVRKGGVFFGLANKGRTLNQEAGKPDLYQAAADETGILLARLMAKLEGNKPAQDQMRALFRMLDNLNVAIGFDQDSNTITIKRGVSKNPLTISIYGSGDDGIAGKVTTELVELIYAKMSEVIETGAGLEDATYKGFWKDLKQLVNTRAQRNDADGSYSVTEGFSPKKGQPRIPASVQQTPEGFTIEAHQFSTLKANIRTLFVDELATAIDKTVMGHVKQTTAAIQKATQIQSIVMQSLFRRAIIEKLLDRQLNDPTFRPGDFMSRKDLEEIVRGLLPMGPAFKAGDQSYFLAGSEQGNILGEVNESGRQVSIKVERDGKTYTVSVPETFARSLTDDMTGTALIYGPGLAGVKSIPTLVIGSGDGQMMLNAANDPSIERTLKVFDGMNMAADMIESYSQAINGHVRQTWNRNPVRDVANAYRMFIEAKPFDLVLNSTEDLNLQTRLMSDALLEMVKTTNDARTAPKDPKTGKPFDFAKMSPADRAAWVAEVVGFAEALASDLERIADDIDKRQATMRRFPMTVDQMASGETPFVQDGEATYAVEMNEDAVLEAMNQDYEGEAVVAEQEAASNAPTDAQATETTEAPEKAQSDKVSNLKPQFRKMLSAVWNETQMKFFEQNAPEKINEYLGKIYDQLVKELPNFNKRDLIPNYIRQVSPETFINVTLPRLFPDISKTAPVANSTGEAVARVEVKADPAIGVEIINARALPTTFSERLRDLTDDQKVLLAPALEALSKTNFNIVFGNAQNIDAWLQSNYADMYYPGILDDTQGFMSLDDNLIVSMNPTSETLFHEIIHATTMKKVWDYYANPDQVPAAQREAVQNIEALMEQWLAENYAQNAMDDLASATTADETADINSTLEARGTAYHVVRNQLSRAKYDGLSEAEQARVKASALNEFMAWVLSNQHLTKDMKKITLSQSLVQIVKDVIAAIRNLIRGVPKRVVPAPKRGDNALEQLRFNTKILMELPSEIDHLIRDSASVVLFQSAAFGQNDRLSELRQRFHDKVTLWIHDKAFASTGDRQMDAVRAAYEGNRREREQGKALVDAHRVGQGFVATGFLTTAQEQTTFNQILTAMAVDTELNANARSRIQDIYDHVMNVLDYDVFLRNSGDPQADEYQAREKLKALQGLYGQSRDSLDRSSLLPAFLALAMVDEKFRGVLSNIRLPAAKARQVPGINEAAADRKLTELGVAAMDRLGQWVSGEGSRVATPDVRVLMDRLVRSMLENTGDARSMVEKGVENGIDGVDRYLYNQAQNITDNLNLKMKGIINKSPSKLTRAAARTVNAVSALVNETQSSNIAMGVISRLNNSTGLNTLRDIATSVVGRQADNAGLFDMITKVRTTVQQTRQQFRESLPKTLAAQFTRKLAPEEGSALHTAFGKTDFAVIHEMLGVDGALRAMTDDSYRQDLINTLEDAIAQDDPRRSQLILIKARQLARYMITGKHGTGLLRNAYAIARLVGQGSLARNIVGEGLVSDVDRLVSLYAVNAMAARDPKATKLVQDLIRGGKETKGLDFTLSYLRGLRTAEMAKAVDPLARINSLKGHIPSDSAGGASLVVRSDRDHAELVKLGYIWVGDYVGSTAEPRRSSRSYYFSPVSGRSPFNQGVMQTVHLTANGIDPNTGFMVGEMTAGRITDPRVVRNIAAQIQNQQKTDEELLPVFDANGNLKAYERAVDPKQLARLERDTNLFRAIGAWAGRQVEEEQATQVNLALVDELARVWAEGKKTGRQGEFVNLAQLDKKADPVLHEAWRLVPAHIRKEIEKSFGAGAFMVRRDMLNDAVGYRSASVGDIFTGETRWDPKVTKQIEDIALSLFGNKAYNKLISTERAVQDLVTNAKVLIVVKSVVVPVANLMSNVMQLLNRGVPLRQVIGGMAAKTAEINDYIRRRHQEIDLEAELKVALGANDLVAERRLTSRIKTLKDSYRSLSIWPLIEAGEFSAISNGIVTAEDLALAEGKWGEWSERLATKMPNGLQTAWRYGFITRDTALFQGLGKATQYGDFLGKAILYEDLTRRRKMGKEEALAQVGEAFVNYNRLSGRSRQYLESVGLLWFYNFKLRSIKEAAYMLRHHPLRSMLMMAMPGSSVITDNLVGVALDGKLGFSMGPSMGLNAFALNPWVNAVN